MYNNVPPQLWMQLEDKVRKHLVTVFNIKRTGITEIRDQTLISDGYSVEDLRTITLEKMNEYIGSTETSFPHAWVVTCSKAKYELDPPVQILSQSPVEDLDNALKTQTTTTHGTKKNKQK